MTDEYERYTNWIKDHYNLNEYNNAYDLIEAVEQQAQSDHGNFMTDKLKQSLIEQFLPEFDQRARAIQQRQEDLQQASDMLGSGVIPRGLSEEVIEDMNKPEVMGIDFENVVPPKPQPTTVSDLLQGGFGFVYGGVKSLAEQAKNQFGKAKRFFRRNK